MEDTILTEETMQDAQGPQSPLEALRARREEVEAKRDVMIQIPGYEDMGLKAKYRLLDRDETDRISKNVRRQTKERGEYMYRVIMDTAISATEGFYLAPDGTKDEDAKPLEDANGNDITTYRQLADALGWQPPSENAGQRAAMLYVFAGNEFALGSHGMLLQRWLNNTNSDIDSEFLGD